MHRAFPTPSFRKGASALPAVPLGFLLAASTFAQTDSFGDWEGPQSLEVYVDAAIAAGGAGTLANPYSSITFALGDLAATGVLGAQDVTINLISGTPYTVANGETFPIVLPAYGVALETYTTTPNGLATLTSDPGVGAPEASIIDIADVGNPELSPTAIRGLALVNTFSTVFDTSLIRIDVPPTGDFDVIAPEIRDCIIGGETTFGVEIVGAPLQAMEPVLERNEIGQIDRAFGEAGVVITGVGESVMAPLIRANRIFNYPVNVSIVGGGLGNQSRIQSNFIHDGITNVFVDDSAPWIMNNTIAFAQPLDAGQPSAGIEWTAVPALGFSHNILWNPAVPFASADVVGPLAVFDSAVQPFERQAVFNVDEDNTLFAAANAGTPGVITIIDFGPGGIALDPGFVAPAATPRDLHLAAGSTMIGSGLDDPLAVGPAANPILTTIVPGPVGPREYRRDIAYDFDFEGREQGVAQFVTALDVGADEYTTFDPAFNVGVHGATLTPTLGAPGVNELDELGNFLPDANGDWTTQLTLDSPLPNYAFQVYGTVAFERTATAPSSAVVENRFIHQNGRLDSTIFQSLQTVTSYGFEPGQNSILLANGSNANGAIQIALNLGPLDVNLLEAEVHVQALVFDPALTQVQSTERITLDLDQ